MITSVYPCAATAQLAETYSPAGLPAVLWDGGGVLDGGGLLGREVLSDSEGLLAGLGDEGLGRRAGGADAGPCAGIRRRRRCRWEVAADPKTRAVLPAPATPRDMAHLGQWVLGPAAGGWSTRLVVRQRSCYPRQQAALRHFVEAVSFVMERQMLRWIKARAEGRHPAGIGA